MRLFDFSVFGALSKNNLLNRFYLVVSQSNYDMLL